MELNPFTQADLLQRLSRLVLPSQIDEALDAGLGPSAPGQVARVAWDSSVFLFLVHSVSVGVISGWFVDTANHAPELVDVPASEVSLGIPLTLGAALISLPAISFDATLGTLSSPAHAAVAQRELSTSHSSNLENARRPGGSAVNEVIEAFDHLRGGDGSISELLRVNGFTLSRLKNTLGVESQVAFALIRGEEALTPDQTLLLSEVSGIEPSKLSAARQQVPEALVDVLMEHRYRGPAAVAAREQKAGESEGWTRLARGALGLAARKDSGAPISWRDRVDRFIETAGL